ncbi:MAG: SLOG family protein [Acidimicrobiales bacterium]
MPAPPVIVYTDGACLGNPGPGGWAWAVPGGGHGSGAEAHTTNQRMEIQAALEAVRANGSPDQAVEVVSDSTYVVNCFRDRWFEGWIRKGWINSQRKPVANRDLWEPLIELVQERGNVTFRWVKGHSGDAMNDVVDRLAVEAAETQTGRSGDAPPTDLGAGDSPGGRRKAVPVQGASPSAAGGSPSTASPSATSTDPWIAGADLVPGHRLAVLGHRPAELGGYDDDNPLLAAVRSKLGEILAAQAQLHDDLVVVSGLRLGAEMLGAEAAAELGIPFVVVLPYPEPQSVWPAASQARFDHLVEVARDVVTLQHKAPESKAKAVAALRRRDGWLARFSDEALVVWDGKDDVLGRLVRSLEDHLGEAVWIVDPNELAVRHRRGEG